MEPAGQKYPAAHGPSHVDDDKPLLEPYLPAGQRLAVEDVEPAGQ